MKFKQFVEALGMRKRVRVWSEPKTTVAREPLQLLLCLWKSIFPSRGAHSKSKL